MKEENIIIDYCKKASEISENDASITYQRNIEDEINKSVRVPFCIQSDKVSLLFKHPFLLYLSIQFTYFFRDVVILNN